MVDVSASNIKWCSVSLNEVIQKANRLEAAVFDIEAKKAWQTVLNSSYGSIPLLGDGGLIKNAFYPGRFKRIYTGESGEPFYLPSQMCDIYPKPDKYISKLTKCDMSKLRLEEKTLLLTRSGTIGSVSLVTKTLKDKVFSDDVIRVTFENEYDLGYCYAFLKTKIGNLILQTNGYGSVITHLEPEHLSEIRIPAAPVSIREKINSLIMKSYELRDESNSLIDEAYALLKTELSLPDFSEFKKIHEKEINSSSFSIKLSSLNGRADASYHVPIVNSIITHLKMHSEKLTTIGAPDVSEDVILPGRFKRTYVEEEYGVRFLGGKVMKQLNPSTDKYLSKKAHKKQLDESLRIKESSILTPARGSLGDVVLPSKQFTEWAISDNMMQIVSFPDICGYLFIFLNSEYGKTLINRFIYGGVVDAIEPEHIKQVEIPILKNKDIQQKINTLALSASELRYKAFCLEEEAISIFNNEIF